MKTTTKATESTRPNNGPPQRARKHPGAKNVRFTVLSRLAHEVFLAGDFNGWNPTSLLMHRRHGHEWSADMALSPGIHEYLFVIDGHWETDPEAESVPNVFGTKNSIVRVEAMRPLRDRADLHGHDGQDGRS
jgi:1,4-alpha-glucan branching enzyme